MSTTQENYGFPKLLDRYAEQIATVSAEDVMRMGRILLRRFHAVVPSVTLHQTRAHQWGAVQEVKP